jgi:hypothetical protein
MQPTTYSASAYKAACAPAQAKESGTSCIRMQEIKLVFYLFFATLLTFPHCVLRVSFPVHSESYELYHLVLVTPWNAHMSKQASNTAALTSI